MISVIFPAHNEKLWINRTIQNLFDTCSSAPEVIVIDQGGNGEIDSRAVVITPGANVGERVAMNIAAENATHDHLFRIDAHCDFSPVGWDEMMVSVTGPKTITVAVLTAVNKDWERLKGHWYGLAKIIVNEDENGVRGLECKWQKANKDHTTYKPVEPNMGLTGCGFMIRKDFYEEIGGADTTLPAMGAIGEEFAIKAWVHGGKVQTRTDVMVGHIFGTGGYNTGGVKVAQQMLYEKYGEHYPAIMAKFPEWANLKLVRTDQPGKPVRTVTVERVDTIETHDNATHNILRKKEATFRYIWIETEHLDEAGWTEDQIREKYESNGVEVKTVVTYYKENGEEIPVPMTT